MGSLQHWRIIAAFEIEGYNVPVDRIDMHKAQFRRLLSDHKEHFPFFIVLYTRADHRKRLKWGVDDPNRDAQLARRIALNEQDEMIRIVDGSHLEDVLKDLPRRG